MNHKILLALVLCIGGILPSAHAQKFAYVDTEYILGQIPEYRAAQEKLADMAKEWENQIVAYKQEIDKMFRDYRAERHLLSEAVKKEREEAIFAKEKQLDEYKKAKFGPGGELDKKREELIKPIQDKVFDAIQELAKDNALDFVFDKAGSVTMLFTNSKFDRSDEVLDYMGIVAGTGTDKKE
ncbi:MAG: OmpH family outer membrane protein [Bacteroidetes bacterium]|jgi:outer membrane protein|nr:OmpH family outer membrane protein [Bacteroidota bacterium]